MLLKFRELYFFSPVLADLLGNVLSNQPDFCLKYALCILAFEFYFQLMSLNSSFLSLENFSVKALFSIILQEYMFPPGRRMFVRGGGEPAKGVRLGTSEDV